MDSPYVILQLTDLHYLPEPTDTKEGINTQQSFCQTLKYASSQHNHIDLLLLTGDLTQDPFLPAYQRIYAELEKYNTRTLCLPGNHDDLAYMQQVFNGKHINCDKRIQFGHWQVICLNSKKAGSQGGYLATDELNFLIDTLKKHPDLYTLIAVHHHPLPTKSQWMDTMTIENNDELFSILRNYTQVKAITCGHIHQVLEIKKDNLLILGTPSTCFQFKPLCDDYTLDQKPPGYRTLLFYPDGKIKTKIHRIPTELIH